MFLYTHGLLIRPSSRCSLSPDNFILSFATARSARWQKCLRLRRATLVAHDRTVKSAAIYKAMRTIFLGLETVMMINLNCCSNGDIISNLHGDVLIVQDTSLYSGRD